MSKILSARDLLDLVRQREEEERQETETVDSGRAGGRRIYLGNTAAMRALRARRQTTQPARGRNNTQLLEQPAAARAARPAAPPPAPPAPGPVAALQHPPARAQERSRLPPAERGRDEGLDPPTPLIGAPALRPPDPLPATGRGRRNTVQMRPQKAEAPPPAPPPPQAEVDDVGEGLPTLEIELPRAPSQPPAAAAAPEAKAERKPEPKQPRKASSQGWVRAQGDPASQPPASPARAPSVVAKPARSSTPSPVPAVTQQGAQPASKTPSAAPPPQAAAQPPPPSDPSPGSPAKTSVASMFSWVTQKPDWAPPSVPIKSVPPPASSAPATVPMLDPVPESGRSLVADEPIALSSEETLVLIHYDAAAPIQEIAERTGLSEWRVQKIVDHLRSRGVLEDSAESQPAPPSPPAKPALIPPVPPVPPTPPVAPLPPVPPTPPVAPVPPVPPVAPGPPPSSSLAASPIATSTVATGDAAAPPSSRPALALDDDEAPPPPRDRERTLLELELEAFVSDDDSKLQRARTEEVVTEPDAETTIVDNGSGVAASADVARSAKRAENAEKAQAVAEPPSSTKEAELDEDQEEVSEEDAAVEKKYGADAPTVRTLLAHFENVLNKLPADERAKIATNGSGDDLFALCFDKDPAVVRALWQNVNISNEHARFAAFHHRTALGLEVIAQRTEFLKDPQIQRRFIRNPAVSEGLLRKMLLAKRLIDIYKVTIDRETTEKTRQSSRAFLRNKFATTDSEDRVELIWKTEGRALTALTGLSIDSKTAALICSRPLVSLMLVQSFCRFAATPPSVIHHFLKQQIVKRQVHLRNALLKHPNCPSDAKRAF